MGQSQLVGGLTVASAAAADAAPGAAAPGVSQTATTATSGKEARRHRFARAHRTAPERVRWRPVPVEMCRLMASPQREVDINPSIRRRRPDTCRLDRLLTNLNRRS
jgi:hypothetical protein